MPRDELETKIIEHDYKLGEIVQILGNLAIKVDKLAEVSSKQEVILERISNLDEKYRSSIDRLHTRIDELHGDSEAKIKSINVILTRAMWTIITPIILAVIGLVITK